MDIPSILKQGRESNAYQELIAMVADLSCMLYEEQVKTQARVFDVLKEIYIGNKPPKEISHPTDILFYRPEFREYCKDVATHWDGVSRINAKLGREVLVKAKGFAYILIRTCLHIRTPRT